MKTKKNMDKQIDVNNQCRTCLNKTKGLHSLQNMAIEGKSGEMTFAELLMEVADININAEKPDEMPQYICGCCSRKLKTSHAFIRQAQHSNEKLLALLCKEERQNSPYTVDCLQESQIDIQTCLEIKMESDNDGDHNGETINSPVDESEAEMKAESTDESPLDGDKIILDKKPAMELEEFMDTPVDEDDSDLSKDDDNELTESGSDNEDFLPQNQKTRTLAEKQRVEVKQKLPKYNKTKELSIAVPCLQCNKIFKNNTVLSRHLRNTHIPEEQKCACPVCGVKFTRACNMFKHMRTQHDPESVKSLLPTTEKMHQCDKCPQKYTKKKHLNNHIKAKHSNDSETGDKSADNSNAKSEERSLCSFCGCSFSKKAYLIVHMRRHTGERPFKCDLCERAFAHNSELKCHRRIHTGEKPYKCKLCEKAFRVYKKLATHMRSHTDERPYKCAQCERSFKYSKDLNIHTRIHTGERPYCCTVCGSTFTQSNSLKAHRMKLGHTEEIPQSTPHPPNPSQVMHLMT